MVKKMTQVNFRIDDEIKANAEKALNDMGLTMSAAITMFLVKVGRERRIPFEITADPFYSAENIAELERRIESIKNGTSTLKEHELIKEDEWEKSGMIKLGKNTFTGRPKTRKL